MKYICEKCKKIYDTQDEAIECEKRHEVEEIQKKQIAAERDALEKEINAKIKAYYEKYKEFPTISVEGHFMSAFDFPWTIL